MEYIIFKTYTDRHFEQFPDNLTLFCQLTIQTLNIHQLHMVIQWHKLTTNTVLMCWCRSSLLLAANQIVYSRLPNPANETQQENMQFQSRTIWIFICTKCYSDHYRINSIMINLQIVKAVWMLIANCQSNYCRLVTCTMNPNSPVF